MVSLRLNLRYGNLEALKGLAVAAEWLPEMMNRGTENMTRQQISDELNNYRAQMRVSGTPGTLSVSVQTSRENLVPVLRIVEEILRHPTFPAEELELIREEQIAQVSQQVTDPVAIAMTEVTRKVAPYASDDPRYVAALTEEVDRAQAVTEEQIRDVYSRLLASSVGELTIVGDFDPEQVVPVVDTITTGWTSEIPFERIARESVNNELGEMQKISTPDKANAAYCATMTIPMRDSHPDFPALELGNFILGSGGLSSRLGDRVRQKDGLSYTIQSRLQPNAVDERTTFFIFAISNPDNAGKVHDAILEELARLVKDGITQEELDAAKAGYLQEQQVTRTDDRALMAILEAYAFIGRDMKYVAGVEEKISALTVDDVNSAIRRHIDPKRLYIVSAGDFEKLEAK